MLIVKVGEGRVEEGTVALPFRSKSGRLPCRVNQFRKIMLPGEEARVSRLSGIKEYLSGSWLKADAHKIGDRAV